MTTIAFSFTPSCDRCGEPTHDADECLCGSCKAKIRANTARVKAQRAAEETYNAALAAKNAATFALHSAEHAFIDLGAKRCSNCSLVSLGAMICPACMAPAN